ncbi:MAG TPA: PLP-dependent aminotransferase family protein [Anaerolineae bacterium]|nr:PLP-dependent aminotransferase family protein [Anaerolineae bacterium]
MTTRWRDRYAERTRGMRSSIIRELLKLTQQPDIISFAGGLPAPELFPVEEVQEACQRVLKEHGPKALQYSTTEGYPPLRRFLMEKMARYGIMASEENILITHGSQQGLDLIGKTFLDPGDLVLLEAPSYLGAIQAWRAYQARFATVPLDEDGMRVDLLEETLTKMRPKLLYLLPNFHNPAGVTLSQERREALVALADGLGLPIIEDDPYGELRYEGEHIPPIIVLDARRLRALGRTDDGGDIKGDVIYISTFSKTLAPGLRLGWVVAPVEVVGRLVQAKQGTDLHTNTFSQMVAYELCKNGFLEGHVRRLRAAYRERRDTMLAAMERHFPEGVTWTRPQGGLFLWATLPEGMDAEELLMEAVEEEKVAFVPGSVFFADGGGRNTMRLNFSNARPEMIEEGIRRLGRAIAKRLELAPARVASLV